MHLFVPVLRGIASWKLCFVAILYITKNLIQLFNVCRRMTEMLPCSGGGQITLRPHALTHDGESVAVCNAERIRVYSASSGEYLHSLKGHTDEVTSVCSHPLLDQKVRHGVHALERMVAFSLIGFVD